MEGAKVMEMQFYAKSLLKDDSLMKKSDSMSWDRYITV